MLEAVDFLLRTELRCPVYTEDCVQVTSWARNKELQPSSAIVNLHQSSAKMEKILQQSTYTENNACGEARGTFCAITNCRSCQNGLQNGLPHANAPGCD